MNTNLKKVFYLSAERVSSLSCVYSAIFVDIANISACFIIASSLSDALDIIYSELSSSYSSDFIDYILLEVKFLKRISSFSHD